MRFVAYSKKRIENLKIARQKKVFRREDLFYTLFSIMRLKNRLILVFFLPFLVERIEF